MSKIEIFKNEKFGNVRVVMQENEPWFVAKDVCDILGLTNPTVKVSTLDNDEVTKLNLGGLSGEANCINESGLYSLIMTSRKPEAKKFKKWVTSEVLPSIRKTGGYMLDNGESADELMARALKIADDTLRRREERIKNLELESKIKDQQITELQPKASYYDAVLQSKDLMTVTQIAKDYGMSPNKLNKMLHEFGVQYKHRKQWFLYQNYAEQGYTHSKTTKYTHTNGLEGTSMHTYWTQKGRLFLYDLLKSKGILPTIEK